MRIQCQKCKEGFRLDKLNCLCDECYKNYSNGWISVKDKLPPIGEEIIFVEREFFKRNKLKVIREMIEEEKEKVIKDGYYWMPLPLPPEKE